MFAFAGMSNTGRDGHQLSTSETACKQLTSRRSCPDAWNDGDQQLNGAAAHGLRVEHRVRAEQDEGRASKGPANRWPRVKSTCVGG